MTWFTERGTEDRTQGPLLTKFRFYSTPGHSSLDIKNNGKTPVPPVVSPRRSRRRIFTGTSHVGVSHGRVGLSSDSKRLTKRTKHKENITYSNIFTRHGFISKSLNSTFLNRRLVTACELKVWVYCISRVVYQTCRVVYGRVPPRETGNCDVVVQ